MEIFVYVLRYHGCREEERLASLLPLPVQDRIKALKQKDRQVQSLYAYALLALALRRELGIPQLPDISYTEKGKPYFAGEEHLHFSLSHTDGAVMAAVYDKAVGVDIEKVRSVGQRVRERLLPGGSAEDFFRLWTRRESQIKLRGGSLGAIREELEPLPGEWCREVETFPGYAASLAALAPAAYRLVRITPEELIR